MHSFINMREKDSRAGDANISQREIENDINRSRVDSYANTSGSKSRSSAVAS